MAGLWRSSKPSERQQRHDRVTMPNCPQLEGDTDRAVLYDSVNSYYAGIARMALAESGIAYSSHYISMPRGEQLAPWYMRLNPAGQVPALKSASGEIVNDSRNIVNWAYGSEESAEETEILDKLYSEDPGSLAWLSGARTIPLLKAVLKSPARTVLLPRAIARYQAQNPDLHDVYQRKLAAMSQKHFSKSLPQVQANLQDVVDWLEERRRPGPWLLGPDFGRVDAVACAFLQWILRCNESGAAPVAVPEGLRDLLRRAARRRSFHEAIGQYGEDAFVLTMLRERNRLAGRMLGVLAVLAVGGLAWRLLG